MDKFTPKHFMFLILGTAVVSLKSYPTVFMRDGRQDSWIAIIASSVLLMMVFLYIIGVWRRNGQPDLITVYRTALGKVGGTAALYLFIAGLFFTLVESCSVEADAMHQNILLKTPPWYLMAFFIVPCAYLVRKNVAAIMSLALVALTLISISGTSLALLTFFNKRPEMLLPIFAEGITPGFLLAVVKSLGLYGFIAISLPYLSVIGDQKNKMVKTTFWGLILLIQMQLLSVAGLTMTFGPSVYSMNYPKLQETQLISFMQFLEFGELYVLFQTVGGWLMKYILTFYAMLIILRGLGMTKKTESYVIYSVSAVVYVLGYFATRDSFRLLEMLNAFSYISLINFLVIPLIVFTIFAVRADRQQG